jgi:glycine/D-amino acid oxidase-like deaminating enzyme
MSREESKVNESAEVVVVGGGIMGSAAALSLVEQGCEDVLLIEREDVGEGTTAAGGGFVCIWGAGWVPKWERYEIELEREGIAFYERLAAEDDSFDFRKQGAVFFGFDDKHEERLQMLASHPGATDARRIDGADVEELTRGVVRGERISGATYHPLAATVTTRLAARAAIARFERLGGRVQRGVEVEGLLADDGRIHGVVTSGGEIAAENVVLATGAWTNALLASLDVWLPIVTLASARICTASFGYSPETPNVLGLDDGLWLREYRGGLLWGAHCEESPYADFVDGTPPPARAVRDCSNDDVDALLELGRKLSHSIPRLSDAPVETTHGLLCFTPDNHPLTGPLDGVEGLFVHTGDNYAGVTHGPGLGRMLAQIVRGEDVGEVGAAFAPSRFGTQFSDSRGVLAVMDAI